MQFTPISPMCNGAAMHVCNFNEINSVAPHREDGVDLKRKQARRTTTTTDKGHLNLLSDALQLSLLSPRVHFRWRSVGLRPPIMGEGVMKKTMNGRRRRHKDLLAESSALGHALMLLVAAPGDSQQFYIAIFGILFACISM